MKKQLCLLITLAGMFAINASAESLAAWTFDGRKGAGATAEASSKNAAINSAVLESDGELKVLDRNDAFGVRGLVRTTSEGDAVDNDTYLSIKLEPVAGNSVVYSKLSLLHSEVNQSGGEMTVFVRTSADNFLTTIDSVTLENLCPLKSEDLDISALGTQTGPVEIRLYLYGSQADYGFDTAYQFGKDYNQDGKTDIEVSGEVAGQ